MRTFLSVDALFGRARKNACALLALLERLTTTRVLRGTEPGPRLRPSSDLYGPIPIHLAMVVVLSHRLPDSALEIEDMRLPLGS